MNDVLRASIKSRGNCVCSSDDEMRGGVNC